MISCDSGVDLMDNQNPRILALDTSSQVSSVALTEAGTLVAESSLNLRSTHSQSLLKQLDTLLKAAGWTLADLDLLAVVSGPGAFTGVRIGVATIKGLAQILRIPVVIVSSLAAVAMNLPLQALPVCVFIDARKKEVYTQLFDIGNGYPQPLNQAQVISPQQLFSQIPDQVCFVGDAVPVYRDQIVGSGSKQHRLAPAYCHPIQASRVAALALEDYRNGLILQPGEVVPTYIRPSDAELSRQAKNDQLAPG